MKLNYFEDRDSLNIDLSSSAGSESEEITDELLTDFDHSGKNIGIDMQHASERIDLSSIKSTHLPDVHRIA